MSESAVETVFHKSWEQAEEFYTAFAETHDWLAPMSGFIRELLSRGFDRLFRHGHAMYFLILSRSLNHGLRGGQPSITFYPQEDGTLLIECALRGPRGLVRRSFTLPSVTLTTELEQLLGRLAQERVD